MLLSPPLLQGQKTEWALTRAHPSESDPSSGKYFGIQLAGGKLAQVTRVAEVLNGLCGKLDVLDLNCGCPIEMVCRTGAGASLLENQGKLVKMLRGMVAVTGDVPVTCKIRMGWSNGKNMAGKLINRLVREEVGVSAVTLHGRSRQQRYARPADWNYIAECAATITRAKQDMDRVTDAGRRNLEYGEQSSLAFIG
jgi:tRNA-dihydrouridine synthase 3